MTNKTTELEKAVRDILNQFDDGPKFCTGVESGGRLVWKCSFITFMERARACLPREGWSSGNAE